MHLIYVSCLIYCLTGPVVNINEGGSVTYSSRSQQRPGPMVTVALATEDNNVSASGVDVEAIRVSDEKSEMKKEEKKREEKKREEKKREEKKRDEKKDEKKGGNGHVLGSDPGYPPMSRPAPSGAHAPASEDTYQIPPGGENPPPVRPSK